MNDPGSQTEAELLHKMALEVMRVRLRRCSNLEGTLLLGCVCALRWTFWAAQLSGAWCRNVLGTGPFKPYCRHLIVVCGLIRALVATQATTASETSLHSRSVEAGSDLLNGLAKLVIRRPGFSHSSSG